MKNLNNKVAAITGAGSGIGQSTAIKLASEGCHLAISDLNEEGLRETSKKIQQYGVNVSEHILDVSNRDAVYGFAADVVEKHDKANIIINNAGVSMTAKISQMAIEDFEWLMNINFWGVVYGTQAFLPYFQDAGEGHFVNISSLFGLVSCPTQSAYNASKFAVRGFTESLRMELDLYEDTISSTSVHPGGIKTNIVRNSKVVTEEANINDKEMLVRKLEKTLKASPELAAEKIVEGIKKNKRRVLIGNDAVALDITQRIMPNSYQKAIVANTRKAFVSKN